MTILSWPRRFPHEFTAIIFVLIGTITVPAQQQSTDAVIQKVDAAVKARAESISGYTVTEHYSVYRNKDETHAVAEMTVKTAYQKDKGKSYTILSRTGSDIIQNTVLNAILDNEKRINQPDIREGTWITSANYTMNLKASGIHQLNGRDCQMLSLTPRRKAPYLIEGTLWVDARDGSIVQVQGTAAQSSSMLTGRTQVFRQYANVRGFSQATHLRAVSNSFLFGQTVVTIDYQNYQVQLIPPI
jgi:outer membrane lipoprotein-sorting protein